jgi:hypothetical protein
MHAYDKRKRNKKLPNPPDTMAKTLHHQEMGVGPGKENPMGSLVNQAVIQIIFKEKIQVNSKDRIIVLMTLFLLLGLWVRVCREELIVDPSSWAESFQSQR